MRWKRLWLVIGAGWIRCDLRSAALARQIIRARRVAITISNCKFSGHKFARPTKTAMLSNDRKTRQQISDYLAARIMTFGAGVGRMRTLTYLGAARIDRLDLRRS